MQLTLPVRVLLFVFGCAGLLLSWVDFTSGGIFSWPGSWLHAAWHLLMAGLALFLAFGGPRRR